MKNRMLYLLLVALLLPLSFFFSYLGFAFTGPSSAPGVGSGAIGSDSSNNVSIGTSTPLSTTKLYLVAPNNLSTNYVIRAVQQSTNPLFIVQNDGKVAIATTTPAGSTSTLLVAGNIQATGEITGSVINGPTSGTVSAGNVSSGQFGQNTGGGNYSFPASLSVGTTSPGASLHVYKAGDVALKLETDGGNNNNIQFLDGGGQRFLIQHHGTQDDLYITNAAGTQIVSFEQGGNVGIGTTDPSDGKLVVSTSGSQGIRLNGTAASSYLVFSESSTQRGILGYGDSGSILTGALTDSLSLRAEGALHLAAGGNNLAMTIATTGNVGIGTTTPNDLLHVAGFMQVGTTAASAGINSTKSTYFNIDSDNNASGEAFLWGTNRAITTGGTELMRLTEDGNVGIGTPNPTINGGGLEISRAGQAGVRVSDTAASGKRAEFGADTAGGFIQTLDTGANLRFYTDAAAGPRVTIDSAGLVGVGLSPSYRLDVVSTGATTARFGTASTDTVIVGGGAGKIDVGTVDPVYTIGGVRYATYLPAMTGVKEETTGIVHLSTVNGQMSYVLDFDKAEPGSDLWLFSKVTNLKENFGALAVLLSPGFEGRVWYSKDSVKRRLTMTARPADPSLQKGELSYRLTAPRFDAAQWSNYYIGEGNAAGFVLGD